MRNVYIVGVGIRKFGRWPDLSFAELAYQPSKAALADAGLHFHEIDVAFCGVAESAFYDSRRVIQELGWTGIMIYSLQQASGSSAAALRMAYRAVATGLENAALVVGYEKVPKGMLSGTLSPGRSHLDVMGLDPIPARLALEMRKRMRAYDEPIEAYAAVAAQASEYAELNPHAHYQQRHSIQEVMDSPIISDPLRLFMCCPVSDGAAAAVVVSEDVAERVRKPGEPLVQIVGSMAGSPSVEDLEGGPGADIGGDFKTGNLTRRLVARLYDTVGLGPEDLDVIQVHDPFVLATLADLEALGICGEGTAGQFVLDGGIGPGGQMPTNTDGGLLSKGHPMGATGVAQVVELVTQLRGRAGPRQIEPRPTVGLSHSSGAGMINIHMFRRIDS